MIEQKEINYNQLECYICKDSLQNGVHYQLTLSVGIHHHFFDDGRKFPCSIKICIICWQSKAGKDWMFKLS